MTKSKDIDALEVLQDLIGQEVTTGMLAKARRESLGLTQDEVAEISGLQKSFISSIENNRRSLGVQTATKLSAAIGLHPSTLLFPNGEIQSEEAAMISKRREKKLKEKAA